jgi:hypothetical protein
MILGSCQCTYGFLVLCHDDAPREGKQFHRIQARVSPWTVRLSATPTSAAGSVHTGLMGDAGYTH